jgi:hypothetical protein
MASLFLIARQLFFTMIPEGYIWGITVRNKLKGTGAKCKELPMQHYRTLHVRHYQIVFNLFWGYKAKCDGRAFRIGFIFNPIMPRHVFSSCYARYEHTRGIKGYATFYLACYVRLQVQNMPYYDCNACLRHLRKYGWERANEQTGGKTRSSTFLYWPHSFPLACLIFSGLTLLAWPVAIRHR